MDAKVTRRGLIGGAVAGAVTPVPVLAAPAAGAIAAGVMKVEWRRQPVGIDTLRPRFAWTRAARDPQARDVRQSAWRLVVASSAASAAAGRGDVWDSGKVAGARGAAQPKADLKLKSQTPYWWTLMLWDGAGHATAWSKPERFVTGKLDAWTAKWIAAEAEWPIVIAESRKGAGVDAGKPMPIFRHGFTVRKPVRHAVLCISGLGHHQASINGEQVSSAMLDPGWTDYRKTVLYLSHDVTALLRQGENAIGVMLGNGMYNVEGVRTRYKKLVGTFGPPKLIAELAITYADGTSERIVSGEHWRTRTGPITFSSIFGGEDHDARAEIAGWDGPGAAAEGWQPVRIAAPPPGKLKAQGIPSMTVGATYPTVKVTEPKPGLFVYDFGKNSSARPVLTVRGPAGRTVKLSPSEVLDKEGMIAPRSIGARPDLPVYYSYTLAGRGEEVWRPRFTYCGSRYLQVECPSDVTIVGLAHEFVHTELPQTGSFVGSAPLLGQIHDLIKQAVLSNSASVFTDCPHREKLGWLEQDHLNAETVLFVEDAITLYEKTIADIVDAQLPSGQVPEIAPEYVQFLGPDEVFRDSPEWGGAVVIAAWKAYRFYGDPGILTLGYPAMKRYADYIEGKRTAEGLVVYGLGDWLDLGPRREGGRTQLTTLGVTATATYYQMLTCLVDIAKRIGRPASEIADFAKRAESVRAAFNRAYFNAATGSYDKSSQTANAMPLALGMVPAGREKQVLSHLVTDIRSRNDHVTAGDVGFHYVVRALSEHGAPEVLHAMLMQPEAPSYGAQVLAGATALTENWDPKLGGSQNHFMLGHGLAWLYNGLGGIVVDHWREGPPITVAPQLVPGLDEVAVAYDSPLGMIRSSWRRSGGKTRFQIEIPAGAEAMVKLPGKALKVGSGRHQFEA